MNKQDLEIAKKIAEIEGVEVELFSAQDGDYLVAGNSEYIPFNWSILGPLMFKHDVIPDYEDKEVCIPSVFICDEFDSSIPTTPTVMFDGTEESLKRAILECIIKSKEQ